MEREKNEEKHGGLSICCCNVGNHPPNRDGTDSCLFRFVSYVDGSAVLSLALSLAAAAASASDVRCKAFCTGNESECSVAVLCVCVDVYVVYAFCTAATVVSSFSFGV